MTASPVARTGPDLDFVGLDYRIGFPVLLRPWPELEALWRLEGLRLLLAHEDHAPNTRAWSVLARRLSSGLWQVLRPVGLLAARERRQLVEMNPEVIDVVSRHGWTRADLEPGGILPASSRGP